MKYKTHTIIKSGMIGDGFDIYSPDMRKIGHTLTTTEAKAFIDSIA
jgi:hypothetical protein